MATTLITPAGAGHSVLAFSPVTGKWFEAGYFASKDSAHRHAARLRRLLAPLPRSARDHR